MCATPILVKCRVSVLEQQTLTRTEQSRVGPGPSVTETLLTKGFTE